MNWSVTFPGTVLRCSCEERRVKRFEVPTLIIHGDDDQIVPIVASAQASSRLVENSTLKVYEGAPHGLADTHKDRLNAELLAFSQGKHSPPEPIRRDSQSTAG